MSKGRKPLPINVKVMQGTHRPGRDNPDAPNPENKAPEMPVGLTTVAQSYWGHIVEVLADMGVVTVADQTAMCLLCETYAEWRCLTDDLAAIEATTYETRSQAGDRMVRGLPQMAQRSDAARRFQSLLSEFGLTPASRDKVKTIPDADTDDPWASI